MRKTIFAVLLAALLLGLTACKGNPGTQTSSLSDVGSSVPAAAYEPPESSSDVQSTQSTESTVSQVIPVAVESVKLSAYERVLTVGERFMPIVTFSPSNATNKGEIWTSDNTAVATVNKYGRITAVSEGKCTVTVVSADNSAVSAQFSVTVNAPVKIEPTYIDGILIVNKSYPLPSNYNPGINPEAKQALDEMFAAAAGDGLTMRVVSGFRSYTTQKNLYNKYVRRDGVAKADTYSARPGFSEHQTGLAFDINKANDSFVGTPEALWLAANAYKYGFILRYPEGKESITGYQFEPWHYRYVGKERALKIYESGLTVEEYYGITSCYK